MHSLKNKSKEVMAKVNLRQSRLSHTKLHFSTLPECKSKLGYQGTSKAVMQNWITKLEEKFAESEKKISSPENKLELNVSNQSRWLGISIENLWR